MTVTVYAGLVRGLKPITRARPYQDQLRGKETRAVWATAETVEKALNKITGRNQGFEVVQYEAVEH